MKELVTNLMSARRNFELFNKSRFRMFEIMEWITDEILEDIHSETYDYVIYDHMALPGKWIAQMKNWPAVSTWSTFANNHQVNFFQKIISKQGSAIRKAFEGMKEELQRMKNRMEQKYGIAIPTFPQVIMDEGEFNIVFTSRYFQPQSESFHENFLFVGPSIVDRQDQGDFPLDLLKEGPVVYMALGTVVNNQPDLYKICLEALRDFEGKVVLSIGNQLSISELGPIPDHFIVRNYVPQLDVLAHSDVFITHCGMNSTSEALYYGNSLVMLPLINDQPFVANRVQELGAGIVLDPESLDAEKLRKTVLEVIENPIYQQNSKKISQSFREAGGCSRAADELVHRIKEYV